MGFNGRRSENIMGRSNQNTSHIRIKLSKKRQCLMESTCYKNTQRLLQDIVNYEWFGSFHH